MSKRVWKHPEIPESERGVKAWRGGGELSESDQFRADLHREFPEGDRLTEEEREMSRRSFNKLMGAAAALTGVGLSACRRPETYIVAYKNAPEWVIPGKPTYYATAMPGARGAIPLVATCYEGRPTKLEPNREVVGESGVDAMTQATILDLYDPNRSKAFRRGGAKVGRGAFEAAFQELAQGEGPLGLVLGYDESPTLNRLVDELRQKRPGVQVYRYEALEEGGAQLVYGSGARRVVDFTQAERILSVGCDFLATDRLGATKGFYDLRQGGSRKEAGGYDGEVQPEKMNRLYAVEAAYSLTGGMADHRLRTAPSQYGKILAAVAAELGVTVPGAGQDLQEHEVAWAKECAADLKAHAGKAVVLVGGREQKGLHQMAEAINQALQALGPGKPMQVLASGLKEVGDFAKLVQDMQSGALEHLVWMSPGNPVYDAPGDVNFGSLLGKLKTSIHLGLRKDATAYAAGWHVPAAHYLESWGDAVTSTGVCALQQPLILPLNGGISCLELVLGLLNEGKLPQADEQTASPAMEAVKKTHEAQLADEEAWLGALKLGFVELSEAPAQAQAAGGMDAVTEVMSVPAPSAGALEVIFAPDASVWDGRFIDNSWLQEAPDPISKLTWDNAAYVSPKTAKALGVYEKVLKLEPTTKILGQEVKNAPRPSIGEGRDAAAPMVKLTVNGKALEVPLLVSFGQADDVIVLPVGYGQAADDGRQGALPWDEQKPVVSEVGLNRGFNAYPLTTSDSAAWASGATVTDIDVSYPVALTQEHHAMYGRALAREISTQEVAGKGDYGKQLDQVAKQGMDSHVPENISLYKPKGSLWEKDKDKRENLLSDKIHQWAMAIDLNVCTGCNACLVACQAENNIPVVGKEQVARGREMHWIRMDRYYATPENEVDSHGHQMKDQKVPEWVADNPEMIPQPVACVQCESAPCETVCPVNATVHTEEGLNAMAYNRCIGTRYCANNCPYKARRFNFFDYNKRNPLLKNNLYRGPLGKRWDGDTRSLQKNPNVSVRMRGVMEKCTYCVQRLESAKIKQKQVGRAKALEAGAASTEVELGADDLRIKTDSVRVACQDACDAGAITFGNLLDGDQAEVNRAKKSQRNYDLLNYIGTLPRTSYLARIKNPNPKMPDAKYRGIATIHMH